MSGASRVHMLNMCRHDKFHGKWSNYSQDVAIFRLWKWQTAATLDFMELKMLICVSRLQPHPFWEWYNTILLTLNIAYLSTKI